MLIEKKPEERIWGSTVSYASGVRGGAPENMKFGAT